jgi:hypothetical protein
MGLTGNRCRGYALCSEQGSMSKRCYPSLHLNLKVVCKEVGCRPSILVMTLISSTSSMLTEFTSGQW